MLRFKHCFLILIQLNIFSFRLSRADSIVPLDLPTEKELKKYLSAVKNVVDFCAEFMEDVDLNLAFGLFVTNTRRCLRLCPRGLGIFVLPRELLTFRIFNIEYGSGFLVNLGHALHRKQRTIPVNVGGKIKDILDDNNEVLNDFKNSLIKSEKSDEKSKKLRSILSLLNNASYWVENMENFVNATDKQFPPEQFTEINSHFIMYMKKVDNFYKGFPNPANSDACLVSLSKNPINMKRSPPRCSINDLCYDMLKRGTNFGYSLTHRILFLLMARFGRGCSVFSEQTDRALVKQFCSMAHAEAMYIAKNSYGLVDLFMEIIALCTVDGQSQFLRRNWLDNMLNFESPAGCYGAIPVKKVNSVGRSFFSTELVKYNNLLNDGCSAHTTGLAAAAFSGAVRFIIEEYY